MKKKPSFKYAEWDEDFNPDICAIKRTDYSSSQHKNGHTSMSTNTHKQKQIEALLEKEYLNEWVDPRTHFLSREITLPLPTVLSNTLSRIVMLSSNGF